MNQQRIAHSRNDTASKHYNHTLTSPELALEYHKRIMRRVRLERQLEEKEEHESGGQEISRGRSTSPESMIAEQEALSRLSKLGFTVAGLRKHCLGIGKAFESEGQYYYSEQWVDDIAKNWITKQDARRLLKLGEGKYYHWTERNGIEKIVIGMVSLVRSSDIMGAMLREKAG